MRGSVLKKLQECLIVTVRFVYDWTVIVSMSAWHNDGIELHWRGKVSFMMAAEYDCRQLSDSWSVQLEHIYEQKRTNLFTSMFIFSAFKITISIDNPTEDWSITGWRLDSHLYSARFFQKEAQDS